LIGAGALLTLTIVMGFVLRTRATELEGYEELALTLRSELHQADAALLSVLVTGEIMPERRADLMGSVAELQRLAAEVVERRVAPPALIDEVERFSAGASETLDGVDRGAPLEHLIAVHDDSIVLSFLATSEIVDVTVEDIKEAAARNRRLADVGAVIELTVVALAIAGTVSWLRRLSSAEEAMGDKDRFIATVSHELRTPLTAVVGMAELLRESPDIGAEARELVEVIAEQGRDVSFIVEDLLVAARDQMSDLSIVHEPMDACQEAEAAVAVVVGSMDSEIACHVHGEAKIVSDPLRFRQIVRNLATNAVRHGGSDVRVDIGRCRDLLVVAVSDRGEPLSAADADAIFEPYTRGPGRTVTGSVGLGLPVSRMLAQRLGGGLTYSHLHGRNVFSLELPAGTAASRPDSAGHDPALESVG
jgi:signal transduction histidine kinase